MMNFDSGSCRRSSILPLPLVLWAAVRLLASERRQQEMQVLLVSVITGILAYTGMEHSPVPGGRCRDQRARATGVAILGLAIQFFAGMPIDAALPPRREARAVKAKSAWRSRRSRPTSASARIDDYYSNRFQADGSRRTHPGTCPGEIISRPPS